MISFEKKEKYAKLAFEWCIINLGKCKRKKKELILKFSKKSGYYNNDKKNPIIGCYCNYRNLIILYEPSCYTLKDIVATVIHEYTHYLQSSYLYEKYEKKYSYKKNPHEIEANKNEKKYTKVCMKYIKNQISTSASEISLTKYNTSSLSSNLDSTLSQNQ